MDKEDARKSAAMEKARLKAEYKKIMNETYENSTRDKKGDKASSSSSSSSATNTNVLTKRKRHTKEEGEKIEVGMRVKSKFDGGDWYEGEVTKVERDKGGNVIKIAVEYDDGDEEKCRWPDNDIVIVENELVEEKKTKKTKKDGEDKRGGRKMGKIGVEREGGYIDGEGTKMFICGEEGCDYKSKWKHALKAHKANIHDLDVTYYLCGVTDCRYKAKTASTLKTHEAAVHDIDVTYYLCGVNACEYKAKEASNLKKH